TPRPGMDRPRLAARDRMKQIGRCGVPQQGVNILQVLAEQLVKQAVQRRGMVVAVPPEPVAPLGDVEFFPGTPQAVFLDAAPRVHLLEVLSGLMDGIPGAVVLLMTDPDGEVVGDPASGEELVDAVPRRIL